MCIVSIAAKDHYLHLSLYNSQFNPASNNVGLNTIVLFACLIYEISVELSLRVTHTAEYKVKTFQKCSQ